MWKKPNEGFDKGKLLATIESKFRDSHQDSLKIIVSLHIIYWIICGFFIYGFIRVYVGFEKTLMNLFCSGLIFLVGFGIYGLFGKRATFRVYENCFEKTEHLINPLLNPIWLFDYFNILSYKLIGNETIKISYGMKIQKNDTTNTETYSDSMKIKTGQYSTIVFNALENYERPTPDNKGQNGK